MPLPALIPLWDPDRGATRTGHLVLERFLYVNGSSLKSRTAKELRKPLKFNFISLFAVSFTSLQSLKSNFYLERWGERPREPFPEILLASDIKVPKAF